MQCYEITYIEWYINQTEVMQLFSEVVCSTLNVYCYRTWNKVTQNGHTKMQRRNHSVVFKFTTKCGIIIKDLHIFSFFI